MTKLPYRFDFHSSLILSIFALGVACSQPAPPAPTPAPLPPPPLDVSAIASRLQEGIDVSDHSGSVQWPELVSQGHSFAFVKATEGVDLKDPTFDLHWQQMKEAGIIRGAYHFYVTEDDPAEQAQFFIDNVVLEPGDLAPVVDVEVIGHNTAPDIADRLRLWLQKVEAHYGVKPIIYTTANFWDANLSGDFGEYPLWVAEYDVESPRLPAGWTTWHLWQWRGDAQVPGVEKNADLSRVNHAEVDNLELFIKK